MWCSQVFSCTSAHMRDTLRNTVRRLVKRESRAPERPVAASSTGKALAVTFVTPHQGATSGGVYAIQKFAGCLAKSMKVHLVVQRGPVQLVPGVEVLASASLEPDELPDADVFVLHADSPDGEKVAALPDEKGRKCLFFQGFGTPGNPVVLENLQRGFFVIASARWLADEAEKIGSRSVHVPHGLDQELFFSDGCEKRNPKLVSMMTHTLDWKATGEGLQALEMVKESHPDVEVVLFGVHASDFPCRFLARPSRRKVGSLFRQSAVFVCSSWEEGFGLPGLEALACGAALATTDTKGSRDYAVHGTTALVSPPRDVGSLAANIRRLIESEDLRTHLAAGASELLRREFKPWPEAAQRFDEALRGLAWAEPRHAR